MSVKVWVIKCVFFLTLTFKVDYCLSFLLLRILEFNTKDAIGIL